MEYKYALLMDLIERYSDLKKIKPSETFAIFEDNRLIEYILDNWEYISFNPAEQAIDEINKRIERNINKNRLSW